MQRLSFQDAPYFPLVHQQALDQHFDNTSNSLSDMEHALLAWHWRLPLLGSADPCIHAALLTNLHSGIQFKNGEALLALG